MNKPHKVHLWWHQGACHGPNHSDIESDEEGHRAASEKEGFVGVELLPSTGSEKVGGRDAMGGGGEWYKGYRLKLLQEKGQWPPGRLHQGALGVVSNAPSSSLSPSHITSPPLLL